MVENNNPIGNSELAAVETPVKGISKMKLKSEKEHIEYLNGMLGLSLWFIADWKNKNPDESIKHIMDSRTMLISHTSFNEDLLFSEVMCSKQDLLNSVISDIESEYYKDIDPNDFEKACMIILEPYIKGRVYKDMLHSYEMSLARFAPSMFPYNLDTGTEYLDFHVINKSYPESFLSDTNLFKKDLIKMTLDAEGAGYKGIIVATWLNGFKSWYKLFPESWKASETLVVAPERVHSGLGFWGQFVSSNYRFNSRSAKQFRKAGEASYPMTECRSTIKELKTFLGIE